MFDQATANPSSQVELTLSASKLADKDVFSKSDPVCIIYRASPDECGRPREIGRTEQIMNSLSPHWATKIRIDYFFETKQPLIFKVYDIDDDSNVLSNQDFLGECSCDLADIVAAPNGCLNMKLTAPAFAKGCLVVHAEEIDQGHRQVVDFKIQGVYLSKKSLFSKPDPFLEFYRLLSDGTRQLAYRSTTCKGTVNPDWPLLQVLAQSLCGLNNDQEFLIECYAYRKNGSHKFIGSCRTSLNKLNGRSNLELPLWNEKKAKKATGNDSTLFGLLRFCKTLVRREYSFIEYVIGGMQLEFAVCVDLTASNGPVHTPQSLHYIDGRTPNQYEMAIRAVLEICEHYNHNKVFDAMGFGAKIPPTYEVKHLFPLNIHTFHRQVQGVQGVLDAYKQCIALIQLYGPTNFEPSIQEFSQKARTFTKDGLRYQILLIITDGVITDMAKTKAAIVNASELPLSIIIIGVGNDGFEKMDQLDADNYLLEANGRVAKRDIVQFVPFRNFMSQASTNLSELDQEQIKARLAKEVLAEVPDQVVSYMKSYNIPARPSQVHHGVLQDTFGVSNNAQVPPPSQPQNASYANYSGLPAIYPTVNDHLTRQPPVNPEYSVGAI